MNKYTFGVWIDVEAESEEDALLMFDQIKSNTFIKDSYCFEWKETT